MIGFEEKSEKKTFTVMHLVFINQYIAELPILLLVHVVKIVVAKDRKTISESITIFTHRISVGGVLVRFPADRRHFCSNER